MNSKMKRMFYQDNATVLFILIALWTVLIYTFTHIRGIVPNAETGYLIEGIGIGTGSFATASCIAVLVHLKKNQMKLYEEELRCYVGGEETDEE